MGLLTLLVVEDEEGDYHLIEMALKETKFPTRVRWVRDGVEAMQYLRGEEQFSNRREFPLPDVMILDLKMPRMGGFEVIDWLRRTPSYRTLPVLVMSSSTLPEDLQRAADLGATTYFAKPHSFEDFVDLLQHIAGYWSYARAPAAARSLA